MLHIGKNFNANRNCNISCINSISIGEDSLFGFNCSVRDSDGHTIIRNGERRVNNKPIIIGNHVWVCANSSISKGTTIGSDCVVGSNSNISGSFENGKLIVGSPGRIIDENVNWEL